LIALNSFFRCR